VLVKTKENFEVEVHRVLVLCAEMKRIGTVLRAGTGVAKTGLRRAIPSTSGISTRTMQERESPVKLQESSLV
jgi:hypothetical protein